MRSVNRFGVGGWLALALFASVGCGGDGNESGEGPAAMTGNEEPVASMPQNLEGDPDALMVPDWAKAAETPVELTQYIPYLKAAYPVIKFFFDFITKGPTLAELLDGAKAEIINEVRRLNNQDLEARVSSLIDRYNSIARNPTNQLSLQRYGTWLDDSYDTMAQLKAVIDSTDVRSGHELILTYNVLVTMHLTMLKGSAEVGVSPFDSLSTTELLRRLKQTNYDFIGHPRTFYASNMSYAVDTKQDSKLWKSDMYAKAGSSYQKCDFGNTTTEYPPNGQRTLCPIYCDLVALSCYSPNSIGTACPQPSQNDKISCLNSKRAQVSANFDADKVVIGVRAAQTELITVYPDPISSPSGDVYLAGPAFKGDEAPISVSSIGSRVDVAFRNTAQQMRHVSFVNNQPGVMQGTAQDYMAEKPATRMMGSNRFWSFYSAKPNSGPLARITPGPANYYQRDGANSVQTGWIGIPPAPAPISLGGLIVDSPAVTGSNDAFVIVNGTNRAPHWNRFDGANWSGWNYQGGFLLQSSPVAMSRYSGGVDYFAVGMDGLVKGGSVDLNWGSGMWDLGGRIGGLALASWGLDRLDMFGVGEDRALYHRYWNGWWSEWKSLGGQVTSKPTVVSWGPGRLDVFARGTDGALWHTWCDGQNCDTDSWPGYEYMGGYILGDPVATSPGYNQLAVFVRGGNNGLYRKTWDGTWRPGVTGYDLVASGVDTPGFTGLYRVNQKQNNSCLDVVNGSTASGADIQLAYPCSGAGSQSFEMQPIGNGMFRLVNTTSNKCMDVVNGTSWDGSSIQQATCNGKGSQAFSLQGMGDGYRIVNVNGKCLETGPNTNVQIGTCLSKVPPPYQTITTGDPPPIATQVWRLQRI